MIKPLDSYIESLRLQAERMDEFRIPYCLDAALVLVSDYGPGRWKHLRRRDVLPSRDRLLSFSLSTSTENRRPLKSPTNQPFDTLDLLTSAIPTLCMYKVE